MQRKFIRVNKAIGRNAKFINVLAVEHLPALVASLTITLLFGIIFNVTDWMLLFLMVFGLFGTWIVTAGRNPKRFAAKFSTPPKWKRGRVIYQDPLQKQKVR